MSVKDDLEIGLFFGILILIAVGIYYAKDWFANLTCTLKPGAIPGITGATKCQVCAAKNTANRLKAGGEVIWSCGSDYDYLQPCNDVVTEVRHSLLGQIRGVPFTFTDVAASCYTAPDGSKPLTPTLPYGNYGPNAPAPAAACCCMNPGSGGALD